MDGTLSEVYGRLKEMASFNHEGWRDSHGEAVCTTGDAQSEGPRCQLHQRDAGRRFGRRKRLHRCPDECGAGDVAGCRSALISLQTNRGILQQDLDAHPAPDCLKAAGQEVRQALWLYQQGAQLGVQGIDQSDAAEVTQGGDLMSQATAHMAHASALVKQASC